MPEGASDQEIHWVVAGLSDPLLCRRLGVAWQVDGFFAAACSAYRRTLELLGHSDLAEQARVRALRCQACRRLGRREEAIKEARMCTWLQPEWAYGYALLAEVLSEDSLHEGGTEALSLYLRAANLAVDSARCKEFVDARNRLILRMAAEWGVDISPEQDASAQLKVLQRGVEEEPVPCELSRVACHWRILELSNDTPISERAILWSSYAEDPNSPLWCTWERADKPAPAWFLGEDDPPLWCLESAVRKLHVGGEAVVRLDGTGSSLRDLPPRIEGPCDVHILLAEVEPPGPGPGESRGGVSAESLEVDEERGRTMLQRAQERLDTRDLCGASAFAERALCRFARVQRWVKEWQGKFPTSDHEYLAFHSAVGLTKAVVFRERARCAELGGLSALPDIFPGIPDRLKALGCSGEVVACAGKELRRAARVSQLALDQRQTRELIDRESLAEALVAKAWAQAAAGDSVAPFGTLRQALKIHLHCKEACDLKIFLDRSLRAARQAATEEDAEPMKEHLEEAAVFGDFGTALVELQRLEAMLPCLNLDRIGELGLGKVVGIIERAAAGEVAGEVASRILREMRRKAMSHGRS